MGRNQKFTRDYLEVIPDFDPAGPNMICRVSEIRGKSIVQLQLPNAGLALALLPPKFRGTLWLRRGALVIASEMPVKDGAESTDKITHVIEHLLAVGDVKEFTKQGYIPEAFKRPSHQESTEEICDLTDKSEDEESDKEYEDY
jgi:probable RNA-binding protein EIF1AD